MGSGVFITVWPFAKDILKYAVHNVTSTQTQRGAAHYSTLWPRAAHSRISGLQNLHTI